MPSVLTKDNSVGSGKMQFDGQYRDGQDKVDRWPFQKRFNTLWMEGMKWYPAWKELSQFCNQTRGFFFDDVPNRGKKIDHRVILDGHAQRCVRTAASGMQNGMTSANRPWFRIQFDDPDLAAFPKVKMWCDMVQKRMFDTYNKSNIYAILYMMYEELFTFGTAASHLVPDFYSIMRGRSYTIGEYFLGCGPDGRVNSFARRYWMTALQLVEEFGFENCTPQTQLAYKTHNTELWTKVNFLIEDNDDRVPGYRDFKNMKYRSLYWEDGSPQNMWLRLGGFDHFPILAPRWQRTTTADIYGHGPGWYALGHSKMLQKEQKMKLGALDKLIDPPMQVDGSVEGEVDTLPGGITRFSAMLPNAGAKPLYQIQPNIQQIREDIMEVKKGISDDFFESFFLMLINGETDPKKTAYEIAVRQSERVMMLGPLLESLNEELLIRMNELTFHYLMMAKQLPPPPPEIRGREMGFEFTSVLAMAQKMMGITAIDQWKSDVINDSQVNPGALDIIQFDELHREKADMLAIPEKFVTTPEVMAQMRAERAKQAAQQAKMQQAMAMAKVAKDSGSAVADTGNTPMGSGSALDALMQGLTNK